MIDRIAWEERFGGWIVFVPKGDSSGSDEVIQFHPYHGCFEEANLEYDPKSVYSRLG
jgi:hypothetical protein